MTAATEKNLLIATVAMFVCAAVLAILLRSNQRPSIAPVAVLIVTATLMLALTITVRWVREHQGPFLTLYDVLISNLFSLGLIFVVIYAVVPLLRVTEVVVLPLLAIVGLWLITVPAAAVPLPATFDNGWLWLHVASGKIFLGLCMVAAAASLLMLLDRFAIILGKSHSAIDARQLDATIWPVFALAFIAHSFMLIAGAVWAYSAWGRYWAWDPLETWTLITWLVMGLLIHVRVTYRQMSPTVSWVSVVAVFVLAFLTFFGVPFISMAPHKGVM